MKEILETEVIRPDHEDADLQLVKEEDFEIIDFSVDGIVIFSGDVSNFTKLFARALELWGNEEADTDEQI